MQCACLCTVHSTFINPQGMCEGYVVVIIILLCAGFSPEILRGGKSLDVYADTSLLQPSGDYSSGLVNCGYYKISGCRKHDHEVM